MSTCSVDKDAIAAHFNANVGMNAIPIIGPLLGQVASPAIPEDHQKDLDTASGDLANEMNQWESAITTLTLKNTQNLSTVVDLMPKYTDAQIDFKELPLQNKTNILTVHMVALACIMAVVIFLGL
jgi:hypothetical protein